ncbi:Coiled-coil domain-containing protein 180 [Channa argus]|uniref:Coiled-coil domain-containing protein 180 n=1 Tax=Channa argus TaxID=215402 RepID=A0A6G1PY26_CHAAH|nr:Coiled-coil domain-containing protein 180 [Channa argus]
MCESRAVPSGKVYRQMFDAQVQLSRSLLTGRRHTRIACPSAEDSASGRLCSSSSREQPVGVDEEQEEVCRLPDTVVVDRPSSDIIARVRDKRSKRHKVALKRLDAELTQLAEVCETQVRTVSQQLLSSLQEVDLRFDTLKDRIEQLDHVSLQEVCGLWEQVEHEVKLKKLRFMELKHKLTECENQRSNKIRAVLRTYCHLLDQISFLPSPDVHRLIHTKATSLLANRRSAARLLLLLQEEKLQQESLLRLHWDECLSRWKRRRVTDMVDRFRSNCSSDEGQQVISAQQMKESLQDLTEQRQDLIYKISSLVPPTCSPALVSDWFNQLTAVNQQIDSLHADFLHQLRCCYERKWQDYLAEVEHCKEALLALQLSEEEVSSVINSQLLTMIGRSQSQDEERLAALDVCCDCVARHTLSVSMWLFALMRGAALLWETHSCRLPRREKEVQQQLDDLRSAQEVLLQRKKVHLNALLGGLRQESSEDTLKKSLENAVLYLQDVKDRTRTLFLDHLEQHFHDVLSSAVTIVTEKKEAVSLEQELQLQQLDPQHIQTHVYTPRLAELQLHRQRVDVHCEQVMDVLTTCRAELKELQTSISRGNQDFSISLSKMEEDVLTARSSQRLFSEGGDFAPQEVKVFQRILREKIREIGGTEESICSELEAFESRCLRKVKEASQRLEEKLSSLTSEVKFTEKVQKIISNTQAAGSNQHQSVISSRLEDLRTMMDNTQVSAEEIFSVLSSLTEGLRVRCQYLDIEQEGFSLSSHPTAGKKVRSAPPPGFLQPTRAGVDLLEDPVVGIIKSLNRSITTDRKFQIFGPRAEQDPHSFSTTVNSVLWKVNNLLLLIAEEFYCSERLGRFLLVPDTLDQWAESMQQRLLGYQEQARRFLSTSREVLIGTHEQRHAVELTKQVGQVRDKLKDTLSASETDKKANMRQLRASLSEDELQALISREELRQQQLHSAICYSHLEIQDCVRAGGGEFLTSLASLTDKLLHHLDNMFTPAESDAASAQWPSKDDTVTIEKGADPGQRPGTGNRTWSGITNLCPPANSTAESPSSVTMATAPTSTKGHVAVIEQRDAAVKRFEQLISLELSSSDDVKRRRLNEVQSWNTHWRQQIHTLKHTHKH